MSVTSSAARDRSYHVVAAAEVLPPILDRVGAAAGSHPGSQSILIRVLKEHPCRFVVRLV